MDENELKPYPIEDTDQWDDNYEDVVGVGVEGIGKRLHAARLAAGIIMAVDAAKVIGLNHGSYRHAEHGVRGTHEELLKAASSLYEVSDEFLRSGIPVSGRDHLAFRLLDVLTVPLMTPEDIEDEDDQDVLDEQPELGLDQERVWRNRLREMRVALGYKSRAALAAAYGWNRYTVWQHETGTRGFGRDRMIGYALAMGVRPEWAVMGEGEMLEPEPIDWKELDRHGSPLQPTNPTSTTPAPR